MTNTLRFQEQGDQRVMYYYDNNPLDSTYSQNSWGRLAAVTFHDFSYMYSYNPAGRVIQQQMKTDSFTEAGDRIEFNATYSWDSEGRMTTIGYPGDGPVYQMTFDAMGRVGSMQDVTNGSYPPPATVATATYGVAGEITGLGYFGVGESRTYNSLFQMTRQTVNGAMDMQYNYTAGANNGRITSSVDWIAGETVNYGYDALNRLASASATNGSWGQAFSYDGFGNLTGKTATAGSPPNAERELRSGDEPAGGRGLRCEWESRWSDVRCGESDDESGVV